MEAPQSGFARSAIDQRDHDDGQGDGMYAMHDLFRSGAPETNSGSSVQERTSLDPLPNPSAPEPTL